MSGLFPIALHTVLLFVFFETGRLWSRRHAPRRRPVLRTLLFMVVLFVLSGFIPALHSLSLHAAAISIASGYLDHFFFIFYSGAVMLLLAGTPGKKIQIVCICALALFSATGNPVAGHTDVSTDRIYTPGEHTQHLLASLESECLITWYRSDHYTRSMNGTPVSILLERIAAQNPAHITLVERDPATQGDPAFAERIGLQPLEDATVSGIMIEYRGNRHLVPVVSDFTMLEYEIVRTLELFLPDGPPYLPLQMLLLGNPENGYEQLQTMLQYAGFTLLPPENPADSLDTSVPLIVIGSTYAEPLVARSIDRFLEGGGSAVFFVSGTEVDVTGDWTAREKTNDPVLTLLKNRGVEIAGTFIRDSSHYTLIMPTLSEPAGLNTVPYPPWPRVSKNAIPLSHPLFSGISGLQFFWPSPIFTTVADSLILLRSGTLSELEHPPFHTHPFKPPQEMPGMPQGPFTLGISFDTGGRLLVFPDEYAISAVTDFTASYDNLIFFVNCAEWISRREAVTILKRTPPALYATLGRLLP